jgi:hypothetical protein
VILTVILNTLHACVIAFTAVLVIYLFNILKKSRINSSFLPLFVTGNFGAFSLFHPVHFWLVLNVANIHVLLLRTQDSSSARECAQRRLPEPMGSRVGNQPERCDHDRYRGELPEFDLTNWIAIFQSVYGNIHFGE